MQPDFDFLDRLADAAARETLPRFRKGTMVDNKSPDGFDPVTEADRAAEAAIRNQIRERFPAHGILGEEHGADGLDNDHLWVLDPIDGTRAFISGLPLWGTLIGLYHNGRARLGVMDQPFTGERFFAGPDGAFYRGPDGARRLATRDCGRLDRATLFTTSPRLYDGAKAAAYDRLEAAARMARYGCDCYAFAMVAAGHADIAIESGLAPYDIAALIPLIEAAGGIVTTWTGDRPEQGGDVIACGSAGLHEEALRRLNP